MKNKMKNLKVALFANDIDYKFLAEKLGRSSGYLAERLMGRRSFTVDEAYTICDLLHRDYSCIPEYFPKGGKN